MRTTITGAALFMRVSRQAIYWAIRNGKLKAELVNGKWNIVIRDIEEYMVKRYNRLFSTFDGSLLFDPKKGERSVKQAAGLLDVSIHRIYYYLTKGIIQGIRKNKTWVIHDSEIERIRPYIEVRKLPHKVVPNKNL